MNLLEFIREYPDEASCRRKFKEYRDQIGVVCPKCGGKDHYWKSDKSEYEFKKCKKRQSLRSGTVMHSLKLPCQRDFAQNLFDRVLITAVSYKNHFRYNSR